MPITVSTPPAIMRATSAPSRRAFGSRSRTRAIMVS